MPTARTRRSPLLLTALAASFLLLAASCGSSYKSTSSGAAAGSSDSSASTTTAAASGSSAGAGDYSKGGASGGSTTAAPASGAMGAVNVATTSLGQVIVDKDGRTLYLYKKDTGPTSTCVDACAKAWPPATVTGTPTAGAGVTAALTTTTRPDGSTQIVLGGHPLYRFGGDQAAGDVNGQKVADIWFVVSPAGSAVG